MAVKKTYWKSFFSDNFFSVIIQAVIDEKFYAYGGTLLHLREHFY